MNPERDSNGLLGRRHFRANSLQSNTKQHLESRKDNIVGKRRNIWVIWYQNEGNFMGKLNMATTPTFEHHTDIAQVEIHDRDQEL